MFLDTRPQECVQCGKETPYTLIAAYRRGAHPEGPICWHCFYGFGFGSWWERLWWRIKQLWSGDS